MLQILQAADTQLQKFVAETRNGNGKQLNVIFIIKDGRFLDVTHFGYEKYGFQELLNSKKCNYVLYYHNQREILLILWIPKKANQGERDLYHSFLMEVKALLKVENLLILDDDIDLQTLENSITKSLAFEKNPSIIRVPYIRHPIDNDGLGCLYYKNMVKNKGKIAQIEGLTGKSTTFGELLQNSVRLALNMQEKGIEYGDIISICSNDNEDVPLTFIASLFLGVTVSALEPSFGLDDLINSLKQICPKMIFVEPKILEKIVEALTSNGLDCRIVVFGATETHTTFSEMIRPVDYENDFRPVPVTSLLETAYIVFTSGTTGIPKTIRHNHHSVQYQYFSLIQKNFCWDMLLHYSTPFWTLYTQFLGITIILGTTRVFYPTFYDNFWDFVKYKITTAFFSVTEISTLCTHQRPKNLNLRGLKILIGGNVVHRNHLERIRTVFYDADLYVCYGFTEIPGTLTSFACKKTDWELKSVNPTSVGTGFPGISYKVVDCVTEEILGPNKVGELRVKAQFPLGGYYKSHPISLWDSYGWLKTGDMVYYNDDRCFYVIDRVKHMFKYKDYHVVPRVLEEILESHPAVQRAAVVGVPNEEDGHHPLGVVVLKSSVEAVTSRILEDFVEQRVADYLRLRAGVKIVDKFPTTRTGKVRKWLLQERL